MTLRPGRALLALLVACGMLVLTPSPSWACSCVNEKTPEHVKAAGTVAAGTVEWTASDGQTRTYEISVDAVYKGVAAASEKLRTSGSAAACGVGDLAPGKRYLFFIDGEHPGEMRIGLCGGTTAYDQALADQVASLTGPSHKPLPAPVATGQPDNADHTGIIVAVGTLVLLLCFGTGVAAVRRG